MCILWNPVTITEGIFCHANSYKDAEGRWVKWALKLNEAKKIRVTQTLYIILDKSLAKYPKLYITVHFVSENDP